MCDTIAETPTIIAIVVFGIFLFYFLSLTFLQTFEKLIRAWKDNTLEFEDLGLNIDPDSALAKEDLVAGEPESFQTDLLKGIKFLQYRVSRMSKPDDRIEQIADVIWTLANTVYDTVYSYFR